MRRGEQVGEREMSDERGRGRREEAEPSLYDLVDLVSRRLITGIVVAGIIVAFGLWSQDPEAPDYQITAGADGRVYRVNTESGWIVGCDNDNCAILLHDDTDLERGRLPERARPALPAPEQARGGNEAGASAGRAAEPARN